MESLYGDHINKTWSNWYILVLIEIYASVVLLRRWGVITIIAIKRVYVNDWLFGTSVHINSISQYNDPYALRHLYFKITYYFKTSHNALVTPLNLYFDINIPSSKDHLPLKTTALVVEWVNLICSDYYQFDLANFLALPVTGLLPSANSARIDAWTTSQTIILPL